MKATFEKFKTSKSKKPFYDKPKKNRRPRNEDGVNYQKLLDSGYSVDDIVQQDLDN